MHQLEKLLAAARQTRCEIDSGTFCILKSDPSSPRGTRRRFAALPQFSFKIRYMPLSTAALRRIVRMAWPDEEDRPAVLKGLTAKESKPSEWWRRIFKLEQLRGVQIPGMAAVGGKERDTKREFELFMSTDGIGCSFLCNRPKRASGPAPTPETVLMSESTRFIAIDPGLHYLARGITLLLGGGPGGDAPMGWPGGG